MTEYSSYRFIKDKNPLIGILATVLKDGGIDWEDLPEFCEVKYITYYGWFMGDTRSPRSETLMATIRILPTEMQKDFWRRVAHEQVVQGIGKAKWSKHLKLVASR